MRFEAIVVLNAPISQKNNVIINQQVSELEEKTCDLEKQLNQKQLDAATWESKLQAQVEKLSRDVDDAREEVIRQNDLWKAAEKKLKASLDASEREQASLIKTRATLTTEVNNLRRDKIFLVEKLKVQSREAKEAKKEVETLRDNFDALNHDAFCNYLQQVMLLNPGVHLNLRGLSVDHTVAEGLLTDICQPNDTHPVDLADPHLKAFDPWAPFVAKDSQATESDEKDGNARGENP
jgi:hypothetical protein